MVSVVDIIQRFLMVSVVGSFMVSVVAGNVVFCLWFPSLLCLLFPSWQEKMFMVSVAGCLVDSAAAGGSIILECIERFLVACVFRAGFRRWFFMVSVVAGKRCFMVSVVGCFMVSGCYRTAAVSPMEAVKNTKQTSGRFRDGLSVYIYIYIL